MVSSYIIAQEPAVDPVLPSTCGPAALNSSSASVIATGSARASPLHSQTRLQTTPRSFHAGNTAKTQTNRIPIWFSFGN
jgi:hypothetical protein